MRNQSKKPVEELHALIVDHAVVPPDALLCAEAARMHGARDNFCPLALSHQAGRHGIYFCTSRLQLTMGQPLNGGNGHAPLPLLPFRCVSVLGFVAWRCLALHGISVEHLPS